MSPTGEVILVLKIALNIAPVAFYFIILGLVNSQSRVHIVTANRDWVGLMIVFFPVLLWPVMWLAGMGWAWSSVVVLMLGISLFVISAPGRWSGWVVYNCDLACVRSELLACLERVGIDCNLLDGRRIVTADGMQFELSELKLLRNVTINIKHGDRQRVAELGYELQRRLSRLDTAPGLAAAAMLISGTAMLMIPLTMMVGHMDMFVRVVSQLIPV